MNNPWLSIPAPKTNLNVLRVDATSPVDAFWAVGPDGEFLFLVENLALEPEIELPNLDSIKISCTQDSAQSARCRLLLKLMDSDEWELFYALCSDLARALSSSGPDKGISCVAERLVQWKSFLRFGKERVLSREAIRGLFGELTFLETRLAPAYGWQMAVEAWGGPMGMPQDFAIAGMVVETKAKLVNARREVRISSEDQLSSKSERLFLHVITLAVAADSDGRALSLAERVQRARQAVAGDSRTADAFEDRLLAAGYMDASAYEREHFSVEVEETFQVKDGFPRLVPECLPTGVHRVSYGIDLAACEPFRVAEGWLAAGKAGQE